MRELRERLTLANDAIARRSTRVAATQLDRDAPFELGIPRAPYDAHAARADHLEDVVATELDLAVDGEQLPCDPRARDVASDLVPYRSLAEIRLDRGITRLVVLRHHGAEYPNRSADRFNVLDRARFVASPRTRRPAPRSTGNRAA